MVDEKLEPSTAKLMLKGSADSLNSAFHLNYNMLLNQLRCEDGNPENMLRDSFYQFQADCAIPDLEKEVKVLEEEDSLKNYYNLIHQYKSLKKEVRDIVMSPKYCIPYMKYGRVLCLQCTDEEKSSSFSIEDPLTWGILVDFHRVKSIHDDDASIRPENANYALNVLTRCVVSKDGVSKKTIKILPLKEHGEPLIVSIPLSQANVSQKRN
ncbi:hypothetical protein SLE2022_086390 [Rubroshorea leprosula]